MRGGSGGSSREGRKPSQVAQGNAEVGGLGSPEASILETLLPAENDVQVKTSVEPKERMSKTRTRIETLPLATPGQKIFPIPSEEGLVVKQKQSVLYIT